MNIVDRHLPGPPEGKPIHLAACITACDAYICVIDFIQLLWR